MHADTTTRDGLLTSVAVMELTGVSYRQLDYWRRVGLLQEAVVCNGPGTQSAFAPPETRVAAALFALSLVGIPVGSDLARAVVDHVRAHGLTGTVNDENGVLSVRLDKIPDPLKDG